MRYTKLEEKLQETEKPAEVQNDVKPNMLMINTPSTQNRRESENNSTEEAEILATEDREEIEI